MLTDPHLDVFNPMKDGIPKKFPEWNVESLETTEDIVRTVKGLIEEIESIRQRVKGVEAIKLPKNSIRAIIMGHVSEMKDGDEIYPSDIAAEHNLDPDLVEEVMDELLEEGIFR